MNKDKLDQIMNCNCLQSIIEHDKNANTFDNKNKNGHVHSKKADDTGEIILESLVSYQHKIIGTYNISIKDRMEHENKSIPFLYCPLCGTKSKHDIPVDSWYFKFQVK